MPANQVNRSVARPSRRTLLVLRDGERNENAKPFAKDGDVLAVIKQRSPWFQDYTTTTTTTTTTDER